jgi:hypothetical protein
MEKDSEMKEDVKFSPIGLIPKWIRQEERLNEVGWAIKRYYDAGLEIPIEWVEEYNELIKVKK